MGLESQITSSIRVVKPNVVELHPGGVYEFTGRNPLEERVAKLHFLRVFADLAAEELACNGECTLRHSWDLEHLADEIFDDYRLFIKAGLNIFEYDEFYMKKALEKYSQRPIVNGHFNAGPYECTKGMADGWWYDFPGQAHKWFDFGHIVIDIEGTKTRICVYQPDNENDPNDWLDITTRGDYREVYTKFPIYANEIVQACIYCYDQYQI